MTPKPTATPCSICGTALRVKGKSGGAARHCGSPTCTWCMNCYNEKRRTDY